MRKSLFLLFVILTMWSCNDENESMPSTNIVSGVSSDFLKLSDDNSLIAGTLQFYANESEVDITWISLAECNLDTTQTKVVLKDGKGILPIRWLEKQPNGSYAPNQTAFKAWVMIKGDNYSKNVPLIWADSINVDALSQEIQTRAGATPKASIIEFGPNPVIMKEVGGGWTYVRIENFTSVNFDYSQITPEMNIDLTNVPASLTESGLIIFPWMNGVAPETGFETIVAVNAPVEGYGTYFAIEYKNDGEQTNDLVFDNSTLPEGNIPAAGGTYDFNFIGDTYVGSVQVNAFNTLGELLATGSKTTTKKSTIVIPANNSEARQITFKYKIDGNDNWLSLPATTNRIQDNQGTPPPTPGDNLSYTPITPPGDIPDRGGVYTTTLYNYVGTVEFRAVSGKGRELAKTSVELTAGGVVQASLTIPEAGSISDNQVIFQYKVVDGEWKVMETRTQIVETFASGSIVDLPNTIPVEGGTYHYESSGTLSSLLTIYVKSDSGVLAQSRGAVGGRISITVPANILNKPRFVHFWYERADQPGRLNYIQRGDQAGR